jgi:hypothetical protein
MDELDNYICPICSSFLEERKDKEKMSCSNKTCYYVAFFPNPNSIIDKLMTKIKTFKINRNYEYTTKSNKKT